MVSPKDGQQSMMQGVVSDSSGVGYRTSGDCDISPGETLIMEGQFAPGYVVYAQAMMFVSLVVGGLCTMGFTLPLLLFWPCGITYGIRRHYESMRLTLTDKTLTWKQGKFSCCCLCWEQSERIGTYCCCCCSC